MHRLTIPNALESLNSEKSLFKKLFTHGSLSIEIYKPKEIDLQQPHDHDEIYVIASGSGYFINGASREKFDSGEVLFVPAGVFHCFENFTADFAT